MKERFLAGYLEEGVAIGLPEELAPLAVSAGLDADEVDAVLAGDAYADDGSRRPGAGDRDRRSPACPFFVIDGRFADPGRPGSRHDAHGARAGMAVGARNERAGDGSAMLTG